MRHNKDVVSAWGGVYDVPHRIGKKDSSTIYVETSLNQVDAFLSREGPLGLKRTISTWLGAGRYIQMVSEPIPNPGVGVCLAP